MLTFERRRLRLLDWLEAESEPVSFHDDHETLGVAYVDPGLRLMVRRGSMLITVDAGDLDVRGLERAVEGVFATLEPKDAVLELANTMWTFDLPGADYNETRADFARHAARCAAPVEFGATFRPVDASSLIDFESIEHRVQVEWGIVDHAELLDRLSEPRTGRLGRTLRPAYSRRHPENFPDVAVLTDVTVFRQVGGQVRSANELMQAIETADLLGVRIAEAIWTGHNGGSDEFAQIG